MKILIIRFSSIGDIVLTTPIVRCVRQQIPQVEVHFLCKPSYANIVQNNPYIEKIHLFDKENPLFWKELRMENFDYIIDLQNNHRSRKLCRKLKCPHAHFPKLNLRKWLLVNLKINLMPALHVVDRYFTATKLLPVSIKNDEKGLDFFIQNKDYEKNDTYNIKKPFIAVAMGSRHKTKQIPPHILVEICKKIDISFVLLGDVNDVTSANYVCSQVKNCTNLCGRLSLQETAACIDRSKTLLTGDSALMHIAAALNKPIVSVWGNTVPAFGMYPYIPQSADSYHIIENKDLRCRPCSKLGFEKCPKKHFKCMENLTHQIIDVLLPFIFA